MKLIQPICFLTLIALTSCDLGVSYQPKLKNPLSIERLHDSPSLSGEFPKSLEISPDGSKVSFLRGKDEDQNQLDLWQFDLTTGKASLLVDSKKLLGNKEEEVSQEERARRERKRIRESGIVEYQWSEQGDKILFPIGGDIYIYQLGEQEAVIRVTKTESYELDPRFSPQGNFISFIRDHNLYIYDIKKKQELQVSFSGTEERPFGVAEFVAQEEMGRYRGYWWSADEKFIAATEVDNRPVENIKRFEVFPAGIEVVEQKYPRAGKSNANVRLGVFEIGKLRANAKTQQVPLWVPIESEDYYITNVRWYMSKETPQLSYAIQTRDQKNIKLLSFNPTTKSNNVLLEEKDSAWVNIRDDFMFFKMSSKLLWVSEKSGFSHIYLFDLDSKEERALTAGDWDVLELISFDEDEGSVYFSSNMDNPTEKHLYRVHLQKEMGPQKLSREAGVHNVTMAKNPKFYLDLYSSDQSPSSLALHDLSGERRFYISENKVAGDHPLLSYYQDLGTWEYGVFEKDEKTKLHYKILKPKNFSKKRKYPILQYVYGGPGVQLVQNSWSRQNLLLQFLSQKGFIILMSDNRGTPHRGRDFEREYYHKFGKIDVEDQSATLEYVLKSNDFIDSERVGVFGHSYGGYLTLMLIMQRPELYQAGVSGAPVVDWSYYDTHYTERYMGTPENNKEGYKTSNVLEYTDNLKGRLLVVHGMADDNVLYNHSLILYQKLQESGKLFDIMAYPGAKHGIRRKKEWQIHYENTIYQYFKDHLLKEI